MPVSLGEAHVVVDLLDAPEIVVLSPNDKPMEGLDDHLEEEDNPDEDQEIDEIVKEQPINEEIAEAVGEQ